MTEHSLNLLQFGAVCQKIAAHCVTEEGKQACLNKRPSARIEEIEEEKQLGADFSALLTAHNAPPIKYRPPILPFLDGIEIEGAVLNIEGIYSAGLSAKAVCSLHEWAKTFCENRQNDSNTIVQFIQTVPDMQDLKALIFAFIDENGELQDLPSLRAIKTKIKKIENDIEKIMRAYFTNESTRQMLQSNLPTVKDGRQVIAVHSNFKGRIPGIIHEYSKSGQSFYLEPEDIVIKNNDLIAAAAEYERELLRLLRELTEKIAEHANRIKTACTALTRLDCISAAARWALSENCVYAAVPEGAVSFYLHKARHPLLGKTAVPIDLKLLKDDRILIITGPNTGGKTVALKTAALFALINQTGWPIPASAQTRLPYFDFIACDIGDEQSLDQSLSTFSAHMKNVAEIVKTANSKSLIVLDELGSGTDPQEGCAISMAVLDELLDKDAFVFVTTHHGALKNYGFGKKGCVNASVEFNEHTLSPAYKIVMGVPGESHAIDIAKRSGLPQSVIEKARGYLDENKTDVSDLIKGLIQKHENLSEFEQRKEEEECRLREEKRKTDLKALKLRQKELELKREGIRRLDLFFDEKRKSLENLVREIREGELTREKTQAVKKWIDGFKTKLEGEHEELKAEQERLKKAESVKKETAEQKFKAGMRVYLKNYRRTGEIIREEKKGRYLVAVDNLKVTVPAEEMETATNQNEPALSKPAVTIIPDESGAPSLNMRPALELRLLGMRAEEAEKQLRAQMDSALVHGITEFAVIHGKGDGILRHLTHSFLKQNRFVKDFRFAKPEDGGSGKTIVTLA